MPSAQPLPDGRLASSDCVDTVWVTILAADSPDSLARTGAVPPMVGCSREHDIAEALIASRRETVNSMSPGAASLRPGAKLAAWRAILDYVGD